VLLSELEFGSYLTYTPRPDTDLAKKAKNVMYYLKSERTIGDPPKVMSQYLAERINNSINTLPFKEFFDKDVSLVPVPKSSLTKSDTLWVPLKIAEAMSKLNMGLCYPCLKRITPIQKAAYASPSQRPTAQTHFDTIDINSILPKPTKIVLIDDVITRGATMIGCASRLRSFFPDVSIKGFAVMRTISNPNDFTKIEDPCVGTINHYPHGTFRTP
jgi:hypothetical protein